MITPRLESILKNISADVIADIGTDHAYIPIAALEDNIIKRAIASDINEGPLKIAEKNVAEHGLSDKVELRPGGGISVLKPGEVDEIIIAGMGGMLIADIIKADMETAKASAMILQPMNAQYELRKFLIENGFSIIKEDISLEGFKVYNLMVVKSGVQEAFRKDIHYHLPPYLKENENYKALYDKKHREFSKVITGLIKSKDVDTDKLNQYKFWLSELEGEK